MLGVDKNIDFPVKLEYGQVLKLSFDLSKGFLELMSNYREKGVTINAVVQTSIGEKFMSNELSVDDLFINEL